jgi:hypothetical protein
MTEEVTRTDLARMANEAAEKLKRETPKAPPHVPEKVDTAKPCQSCGAPAVHFTGTGKGTDAEGKPFDETTGNFCGPCFVDAMGQWGDPRALLPEVIPATANPYPDSDVGRIVGSVDRLSNTLAQGIKALVLVLEKIERRTGA